jgi:anti-sigma factor RsiW
VIERRPGFDALSAYVDGELAPEQAARVAAAAASDPEVAGQLATLHALRASVSQLKPEVVISPLDGAGRPRGRRARAGGTLLLAGAAAVVIVAALAWHTRTAPVVDAESPRAAIQPLIDDHDAWIATGASDYREVAARSNEFRQLLAQAGLDLVHTVVSVDDDGRLTRHYGFLGSRGCRLSLFESPGAAGAGAVATAVDAGAGLATAVWAVGDVQYVVVARSMSGERFATVVAALRDATQRGGVPDPYAVAALRDARQPCTA